MTGIIRKVKGKDCFFLEGKQVTRAAFDKALDLPLDRKPINKRCKRAWPMKNVALAVTRKQVGKAQADAVKKGVPTEFTKGGRPIFRDNSHYRKYLKAYGYVNWDSYSG